MIKNKDLQNCIMKAESFVRAACLGIVALYCCVFIACNIDPPKKYEVIVEDVVLDEEDSIGSALESCLQDVQNKCKGVIDYALTLELENARLHKLVQELQSESLN